MIYRYIITLLDYKDILKIKKTLKKSLRPLKQNKNLSSTQFILNNKKKFIKKQKKTKKHKRGK